MFERKDNDENNELDRTMVKSLEINGNRNVSLGERDSNSFRIHGINHYDPTLIRNFVSAILTRTGNTFAGSVKFVLPVVVFGPSYPLQKIADILALA